MWVGTDISGAEIPGQNKTERVVFRDAATGRELARGSRVPQMTQGSAVQPGYGGSVFFPVATGTLIKVTPHPVRLRSYFHVESASQDGGPTQSAAPFITLGITANGF